MRRAVHLRSSCGRRFGSRGRCPARNGRVTSASEEDHGQRPKRDSQPRTRDAGLRNLVLGTLAFAVAFTVWGLLAPLARKFEDDFRLSDTETAVLIVIPVVLGSLLRIPVGWLTDKLGGRLVFTALLLVSAIPAVLLGYAQTYGFRAKR